MGSDQCLLGQAEGYHPILILVLLGAPQRSLASAITQMRVQLPCSFHATAVVIVKTAKNSVIDFKGKIWLLGLTATDTTLWW